MFPCCYALTHARNRFERGCSATAGSALVCGGAQQTFPYVSFMGQNLSYVNLVSLARLSPKSLASENLSLWREWPLHSDGEFTHAHNMHAAEIADQTAAFMRCCYLALLQLGLLWCVVEIHSQQQTFPYVSFMGQNLSNHSYVDLSLVGNERIGGHSVQCHTDLVTCCRREQGPHRGDWYFPNGDRLPIPDGYSDIVETRVQQRVDLRRNNGTGPSGIYHCDIPTNAVHENDLRETVYVGLYFNGGITNGHSQ